MKLSHRLLALLLTLTLLFGLAACGSSVKDATTTTVSETETEKPALQLDLIADKSTEYILIRSEDSSDAVTERTIRLRTELMDATGTSIGISTDWVKRGTEVPAEGKEIVIGTTNRPQTLDALTTLREKDFVLRYDGQRLVVTGGCDSATLRAVDYLFDQYVSRDSGKLTVPDNLNEIVRYDYPIDGLAIDGVDIRNYRVVVPKNCDLYTYNAGLNLVDFILNNAGIQLELVRDDVAESQYEFLIGQTNRTTSVAQTVPTGNGEYLLLSADGKIVMQGASYLVGAGVGAFLNEYVKPSGVTGEQNITNLPTTAQPKVFTFAPKAENAILMIGDGMGYNHIACALANGLDAFVAEELPNRGSAVTRSQSVLNGSANYTDSAAAATALATGYKTINGFLGVTQTNKTIQNVRELAHSIGAGTAVLTTDVITGATPSGFLCHHNSRTDTAILQKQIDTLLEKGEVEYAVGSAGDKLAADTRAALNTISEGDHRFFAMIEEGYIDKNSHNVKMADMIKTVIRFNDAIAYAVEFTMCHPNTALIITADHETGGINQDPNNATFGYSFSSYKDDTHTGCNHTNRDVPVFAVGAGTEKFNNQKVENVEIAKFMALAYGSASFGQ